MKFRTQDVEKDGVEFRFVTRTSAKKMSQGEIRSYFKENGYEGKREMIKEDKEEVKTSWQIPDERPRQVMFMNDLKLGLEFCAKKYNVSEDQIVAEARRITPHLNTRILK